MNYWDNMMEDEEHAGSYMLTYGEGPGSETRRTVFSFVNEGESVLDVGCGPGWNYDHARDFGPKITYTGMDYSELFIKAAQKRNPGAHYIVGDCRKLPFKDGDYDVVLLQDVLEHTNGYEEAVKEALRVARKRVIITFWRGMTEGDTDQINDDGDDGYGATYSKVKWEKFLESLELGWSYLQTNENRWHEYYILEKEEK